MILFGQCNSLHLSPALRWGFGSHVGGIVGNKSCVLCVAGYAACCSCASAPGWRGPGERLQGKREVLHFMDLETIQIELGAGLANSNWERV